MSQPMSARSPHKWRPYIPTGAQIRVAETSCCGEYEFCSEGGQYFILRNLAGEHEETARGVYADTRETWSELVAEHAARCPRRRSSRSEFAAKDPRTEP